MFIRFVHRTSGFVSQDLRKPPASILDLSSGSGQLSKLIASLETTEKIRMMDHSGKSGRHSDLDLVTPS